MVRSDGAGRTVRSSGYPERVTFPVVGMVGGGQLARMTHEAGIPLGIRFKLLSDTPQDSAAQVAGEVVVGDYRDRDALRDCARG
ncbi:5-(carboxyamino)imidazole ribonucleotide synthase, partial [[Kitasatospora] papulosa]